MKEMELKIKDVAQLISVSEKTIYRWIVENKIPAYRVNHQYRFNKDEINNWILNNKLNALKNHPEKEAVPTPSSIYDLFKHGGIYYKIEGETVETVLRNSIEVISVPPCITRTKLYEAILDRERLMSTAVGNGIAIPHPRESIVTSVQDQSISLCFLNTKIDYSSLDGEAVNILFFILTSNPKNHLEILYKIIFLCQKKEFIQLLERQALRNEILQYIEEQEKDWALAGTGSGFPENHL
jgi:PTS system nitrogen regulatory IIA component